MSDSNTDIDVSMENQDAEQTRIAIAEAIAKRAVLPQPEEEDERQFALERDTRQEFRRLLDPGIARGAYPVTLEGTLKMLSTIAENLLKEPGNEKFQHFKPTNSLIKKHLVEVKGALEYAIALGFRAEVANFQPFYSFHPTPKNMTNLRIGAAVLREALDRTTQKMEQAKLNRVDPKAVQREIALKVKLAYEDDRKEKKRRDELEKQVREARAAAAAKKAAAGSSTSKSKSPTKASSTHPEGNADLDGEDDYDEEGDEEHMSMFPVQPHMKLRGGSTVDEASAPTSQADDSRQGSSEQ